LNEGNTPLIESRRIVKNFPAGVKIFFKYEGLNPTGSFKDRGMTMAITKAYQDGSSAVICASTGNTSAAAAAYAARAGMRAFVLIPEGKIALGKLSQAMIHGAVVVQIEGNFDDALNLVREISDSHPITLVNSVNPYRIEGQKSGAFEVVDQLGDAPTFHALPVGNAGNITAYWKGYTEFFNLGKAKRKPKMIGFQAAGSAPIVQGSPVLNPETVATAIRIGNPASWKGALDARDVSGGLIDSVTDEEILGAYSRLAAEEGVFCEPASAAGVAGILKHPHLFKSGDVIVCTLTGHGLKDPDNAVKLSNKPTTVKSDKNSVLGVLGFR
jgi:threonine synthase